MIRFLNQLEAAVHGSDVLAMINDNVLCIKGKALDASFMLTLARSPRGWGGGERANIPKHPTFLPPPTTHQCALLDSSSAK